MRATASDLMRSQKREISSTLLDLSFDRIIFLILSFKIALAHYKWIASIVSIGFVKLVHTDEISLCSKSHSSFTPHILVFYREI